MQGLATLHRGLPFPTDAELCTLIDAGVPEDAMARPWCLRGARVQFDGATFDFDAEGEPAIIFRAEDGAEIIDLIAWRLSDGKLASWRGAAFCLGDADAIFNSGSFFDGGALRVHRTPLGWLKAERGGLCLVKPEHAYAYLAHAPKIAADDAAHARDLRVLLLPPVPRAEIVVARGSTT